MPIAKEHEREPIENLNLPVDIYNVLKKRIGYIDALVYYGEEGLRKIDDIDDESISVIKKAMKEYGVELPAERTKRVRFYFEKSVINPYFAIEIVKWVPGPEEYMVIIWEYVGRWHKMWIAQNYRYSKNGKRIVSPPVFDSLEKAIDCAKELLREQENKRYSSELK
jgi:hypothetical protein